MMRNAKMTTIRMYTTILTIEGALWRSFNIPITLLSNNDDLFGQLLQNILNVTESLVAYA